MGPGSAAQRERVVLHPGNGEVPACLNLHEKSAMSLKISGRAAI